MKQNVDKHIVWIIGATDSSGGAGINNDIAILTNFTNIHTCSIISAITAQSSSGIDKVQPVSKDSFNAQLNILKYDLPPHAIKISVLTSLAQVEVLSKILNDGIINSEVESKYGSSGLTKKSFIIYDPVLISSSNCEFTPKVVLNSLIKNIFRHISLLTPNIPEAELIANLEIKSKQDMINAAKVIINLGVEHVLIKGGHLSENSHHNTDNSLQSDQVETISTYNYADPDVTDDVYDLFMDNNYRYFWCISPMVAYVKTIRGTGCKLASLILGNYLQVTTYDLKDAVILAKMHFNYLMRKVYKLNPHNLKSCSYTNLQIVTKLSSTNLSAKVFPKIIPDFMEKYPSLIIRHGKAPNLEMLDHQYKSTKVNYAREKSGKHIGLYPIVPSLEWIVRLAKCGVKTIQLRIKDDDFSGCKNDSTKFKQILESQITQSIQIARKYQLNLYINDYYDLAIKYNAPGVHLGQEDLQTANLEQIKSSNIFLGISSHSLYELGVALLIKPNYIALGPIYPTKTKEMPFAAQGIARVKLWERLAPNIPIVAIGGINSANIDKFPKKSLYNVAMISAIINSAHPELTVNKLLELLGS